MIVKIYSIENLIIYRKHTIKQLIVWAEEKYVWCGKKFTKHLWPLGGTKFCEGTQFENLWAKRLELQIFEIAQ